MTQVLALPERKRIFIWPALLVLALLVSVVMAMAILPFLLLRRWWLWRNQMRTWLRVLERDSHLLQVCTKPAPNPLAFAPLGQRCEIGRIVFVGRFNICLASPHDCRWSEVSIGGISQVRILE